VKRTKLNVLIATLVLSFCLSVDASAGKLVDVEAASITYEINTSANMAGIKSNSSGSESLYLKSWGEVQKREETLNVSDIMGKRVEREVTLLDGGSVYSVDFESKVIHKTPLQALASVSPQEFASFSENWQDSLRKMGAKKIGDESILGYPCEIWEMSQFGSKVWIHKGLTLKTVTNMAGIKATSTAVDVEIGTPSDSKFKLPDFPVVQGDAGFMPSKNESGMPGGFSDDAAPSQEELKQAAEAMKKLMQGMQK
jgi:hypothetical protein